MGIAANLTDSWGFYTDWRTYIGSNVGLGVSQPQFRLHLSTDSAAKPGTNTWTIFSDRRLKKDITPLVNSLDKLLQLHGVNFRWIDPASQGDRTGVETGLIAQDVEEVFPEWVQTAANGYKTLTIGGFEALTAEALRELRTEKDAQIQHLNSENADLRARVESLETMMREVLAAQSGGSR